jgi:hypothetical protein
MLRQKSKQTLLIEDNSGGVNLVQLMLMTHENAGFELHPDTV